MDYIPRSTSIDAICNDWGGLRSRHQRVIKNKPSGTLILDIPIWTLYVCCSLSLSIGNVTFTSPVWA